MAEARIKTILLKWVLPLGILIAIFIGLLIQFIIVAYDKAVASVEVYLMNEMSQYSADVKGQIEYMTDIGQPIAYVIEHFEESDPEFGAQLRNMLVEDSEANLIVYADITGKGLTQDGIEVNLRAKRYYLPSVRQYQVYSYAESDDIIETPSIISAIPVVEDGLMAGVMYMFYPVSQLRYDFYINPLSEYAHMMVMDGNGTILFNGGPHTKFLKGVSVYDLFQETGNDSAYTEMRVAVRNRELTIMEVNDIEGSKYMAIVPLLVNDTFITLTFDEDYVEGLISEEWEATQYVIVNIILAFVVLIIASLYILYIINRIYKERNKSLEKKADKDLLTDVYNKIATEEKIKEYIERFSNQRGVFCLVDIDDFKNINDTRGHAFGDQVLKEIALRLETAFRVSDIVGRIGGDEFLVFVKNLPEYITAEEEAAKIENVFRDFKIGEYVKYSVTASVGVSAYPEDGTTFNELYVNADKAVYIAKKRGKNRAVVYKEGTLN